MDTDIGGMLQIANLPAVGSYFERKVIEVISESLVRSKGGGFYLRLPVPYIRKAMFNTASKEREMERRGESIDDKIKTPIKKVLDSLPVEDRHLLDLDELKRRKSAAMDQFVEETVKPHSRKSESISEKMERAGKGILSLFESEAPADSVVRKLSLSEAAPPPIPVRGGNESYYLTPEVPETAAPTPAGENDNTEAEEIEEAKERKREKLKQIAKNLVK